MLNIQTNAVTSKNTTLPLRKHKQQQQQKVLSHI